MSQRLAHPARPGSRLRFLGTPVEHVLGQIRPLPLRRILTRVLNPIEQLNSATWS